MKSNKGLNLFLIAVLALGLAWFGRPASVVLAGTFGPVTVTDQTPTAPLANPAPGSFEPRYVSGFGSDNSFTVFFEDRNAAYAIGYAQTTTGPTGFPAAITPTNIADTHFCVKDWPITIGVTTYAYRAWASHGNDMQHEFYVSNNLTNWTLVSTFTIPNAAGWTGAHGWVYYGFHDVILLNGTYYAFAESNQSQTMLVRSANGDDVWEAFDSIGGRPGWGPLELPTGVSAGWTPTGSFIDLGHDRGYGKLYADPRDNNYYLAVNTAAKPSLAPAALEAAFITPANWTWHDGSTGPAAASILSDTPEHDLREAWVVPNSDPNAAWVIMYNADWGAADGSKALGYATLSPPAPPPTTVCVDDDFAGSSAGDPVNGAGCGMGMLTFGTDAFDKIQDGVNAVAVCGTVIAAPGLYQPAATITLNKCVTLQGPQAGVDPRPFAGSARTAGDTTTEAVIDGQGVLNVILNITASQVVVDGVEVKNGKTDLIQSPDSANISDVVVRYNIIHQATGDEGIQIRDCANCTIGYNTLYDIAQDGVNLCCGSTGGTIQYNEITTSNSENGVIYVYEAENMTIEGNYIHGTTAADGIKLYENGAGPWLLHNNLIVQNNWSKKKRATDNNAIHIYKASAASHTVAHNTLDGNQATSNPAMGNGIMLCDEWNTGFVTTVSDNIISNHAGYGIAAYCNLYGTDRNANVNYDHNDMWQNSLGQANGTAATDTGGNIATDPQYMNAAVYDYRLQTGSPAIDTGSASGVTRDIVGTARPLDNDGDGIAERDMGAYESIGGTIIVEKQTDPDGDLTEFTFSGDVAGKISDGGQLTAYLPPGTYTSTEADPTATGFQLIDISCDDASSTSPSTGDLAQRKATFHLEIAETVKCTFTNSNRGSIEVCKDVVPDDASLWDFTLSGPTPGTKDDLGDGMCHTWSNLASGAYTLSEATQTGYDTAVDCGTKGSATGGDIAFTLNGGENVTCTFTNTAQPGSITVVKQVVGQAPAADWSFSGDLGSFTLPAAGGQQLFCNRAAGDYTITEAAQSGYGGSVVCDSGENGCDSVTVHLDPGEDVVCTFTNTAQPGSITVVKQVVGQAPAADWSFSGDLGSFTLPAAGGQQLFCNRAAGDYTITEAVQGGYAAAVSCDSGENGCNSVTVSLGPGENVICTFTNTAQPGTIIVEKQTDPDGATDTFTFTGDAAGSIKDGEQIVVSDLLPGTYTAQETVPADWELTAITCDDGDSTGDPATGTAIFNVAANETVKCTFSNRLKRGMIVVEKQTDPDGAPGAFTFTGDAAGTISDGGQIVVDDLLPGTYTSTEADPAPQFELTSITCNDGNSTGNVGTRTATFRLEAGETVQCTFGNAQRALQVTKEILWPVGGLAAVGQEIRFLITIHNSGGLTIDPLTLRDEYDPWCLTSQKAQTPPDMHGGSAGFLQWNDLGPLAPGNTVTLWVQFTANHACDPATNTAIVETGGLTFRDEATLRILETVAFVGGRVFHDEIGAGTHLGSTRGVEGAQVSLDSLLYTTNTSGWYSFNLLDPGTYTVMSAPPAGSWWLPTTSETCAATIANTWDQVFCNFGYWWGLDGPPVDGLAAQQQVTLTPVQDATISEPEPGNHGAEQNLWVRQPDLSSTLVQFDLSGLPAGAQIVWAKLRLYAASASNPDNRLYMTAYPLSKMWMEGAATWDEAAAGLPWDAAGAVGAGDHADPVGWAWTNTLGWVAFDLDPAVVAAWLADPGSNHGLLLRGEGSSNRKVAYWFLSKEHGNGAAHPQLVVGYNLP